MALFKCKECGKEGSTSAKSCPHCGTRSSKSGSADLTVLKIVGGIVFLIILGKMLPSQEHKGGHQDRGTNGSQRFAESDAPTKESSEESRKTALTDLLRKKFGKRSWNLKVQSYDNWGISVYLSYRDIPDGYPAVEDDTKAVARFILDNLLKEGRQPAKEGIFVWVSGQHPVKGETGKDLVQRFGTTHYDPTTDQLTWEPNK